MRLWVLACDGVDDEYPPKYTPPQGWLRSEPSISTLSWYDRVTDLSAAARFEAD